MPPAAAPVEAAPAPPPADLTMGIAGTKVKAASTPTGPATPSDDFYAERWRVVDECVCLSLCVPCRSVCGMGAESHRRLVQLDWVCVFVLRAITVPAVI